MGKTKTPVSEQYRMVMEARQSGLSDAEWCRQHGIAASTFYNWVVRLRKRGCEIPDPWNDFQLPAVTQDVVLLDVIPDEPVAHSACIDAPSNTSSLNPVKNSRLDKAVTYISNRREFLITYLEDGRCSFSNNASENAIRPFTVGRKNWLFSDSPAGATASATIYSIVEMAKANDLNIYKYIEYILNQSPSKSWTDDQLELIAPWNPEVLANCKN